MAPRLPPRGEPASDEQLAELAALLKERGVPADVVDTEPDLAGLAADVNIRGRERISLREAADRAGLDVDDARRVWLTAGVAVGEPDEPAFTPDEARVLAFFAAARDLFGEGPILQVLRVLGSAFVRIAEAETAALRLTYEVPHLDAGGTALELVEGYQRLTRVLLPEVEATFGSLHRLHLSRAARRAWSVDEEAATTLATVAVGFADLAGFTSLAGSLTPNELAGVVDAFDELAHQVVHAGGGQLVKLIGDEVMFVADDVTDGLAIALDLADDLLGQAALPGVRVGLAAGQVLNRDGDYYGSVVNLAARLVDRAEPGTVLADDNVATVATGDPGLVVEALAPVAVKGFATPVAAHRVGRRRPVAP